MGCDTLVARDFARFGPHVRAEWDAFEEALARESATVQAGADAARRAGRDGEAAAALTAFMEHAVARFLTRADGLVGELRASA